MDMKELIIAEMTAPIAGVDYFLQDEEESVDMDELNKNEDSNIDDDPDKEPDSTLGEDSEIDDESDKEPDSELEDSE